MLIPISKDNYVTKSEALLKARYHLRELALKLISIVYSNVKRSDEIGKEYEVKVIDIANLMNKNYGEMYNLLKNAVDELLSSPVRIEDKEKKEWVAFNWISDAKYQDGVISFTISKRLRPFILDLQEKFLKYKLENILSLRGTYVIRLYEILKDKFNEKSRYSKKTEFILSVKELREMLEIPRSYQYSSHIKKLILEKAKKQFEKFTDITFDYEEIKTGRKVNVIKFIIKENFKNNKQQEIKDKGKELNASEKIETFNSFRKEILSKVDDNKIIVLDDRTYKIKNDYLFLNDKLLNREEALEHWKLLYENKDSLQIKTLEEIKKENLKKIEDQLNETYLGKKTFVTVGNDYLQAEVVEIQVVESTKIKVIVKAENNKFYATEYSSIDSLKNL
jgi:plasmid replication initiation protein